MALLIESQRLTVRGQKLRPAMTPAFEWLADVHKVPGQSKSHWPTFLPTSEATQAARSRGGSVPLPLPPVETIHGSRRLPPRRGASRPVAWRERPAPDASGRDHTREPEAPATTPRKPPGRVAGASRSRCLRSRPYTGAGGSRHDAAQAARSRGGSVPLPMPPVETIHGSRRLPPRPRASRPVAWRERPAPDASGRDHTREPEAPATTPRKPPGLGRSDAFRLRRCLSSGSAPSLLTLHRAACAAPLVRATDIDNQ
jgi:hypothetical protein